MRVEITEVKLSDSDPETGSHYVLGEGDTVTVSDATGKRWCSYGWAKDLGGKIKTGERIEGARAVEVQDADLGGK